MSKSVTAPKTGSVCTFEFLKSRKGLENVGFWRGDGFGYAPLCVFPEKLYPGGEICEFNLRVEVEALRRIGGLFAGGRAIKCKR